MSFKKWETLGDWTSISNGGGTNGVVTWNHTGGYPAWIYAYPSVPPPVSVTAWICYDFDSIDSHTLWKTLIGSGGSESYGISSNNKVEFWIAVGDTQSQLNLIGAPHTKPTNLNVRGPFRYPNDFPVNLGSFGLLRRRIRIEVFFTFDLLVSPGQACVGSKIWTTDDDWNDAFSKGGVIISGGRVYAQTPGVTGNLILRNVIPGCNNKAGYQRLVIEKVVVTGDANIIGLPGGSNRLELIISQNGYGPYSRYYLQNGYTQVVCDVFPEIKCGPPPDSNLSPFQAPMSNHWTSHNQLQILFVWSGLLNCYLDSIGYNWWYNRWDSPYIQMMEVEYEVVKTSVDWVEIRSSASQFQPMECEDIRVFGTTCADTVQDKAIVPLKIGEGEVRRGSLYDGVDGTTIENLVKGQTTFADELHGHKAIQNMYDEWAKRWYYKKIQYNPQPKPAEDQNNGAGIIGFKTTSATSSMFPPAYNIDNVDEALFALSWWMRDLRKKPLPVIQETMHSSGRLLNLTFVPLPDNHLNGGFWKDGIPVIEEQCSWIVSPTFLWGLGGAHAPWVYLCTTLGLGQGGEYTEEGAKSWDWPGWLKFFEALCNGQFMYGRWLIHFLITSGGDILTSLLTILGTHANYHIVGTHWWGTDEEQQVIDHKSYRSFPLIDMAGVNLLSLSSNTPKTPVPPIATIKHTYVGGTHRLQYKAPTDTYGSEIILPKYKDAVYQLNSNNTSYWCKVNIVYNLLQSVPLETSDINTLGYINGWTAIKKQYVESQMEAQHNGMGYEGWNPWWIDNK